MSNKNSRYISSLLFVIVFLSISSCKVIDPEKRVQISSSLYEINSETILTDLSSGDTDIFTPRNESSINQFPTQDEPVLWDENGYFMIADALHELVWGEPLESWKLNRISFIWDCKNIYSEPQYGFYRFFKIETTDGKKTRLLSELVLDPQRNAVLAINAEYQPVRTEWPAYDLLIIRSFLNEAIKIAEENGGSGIRSEIENECEVMATLNPGTSCYDGWAVHYLNLDGTTLQTFFINHVTGEFEGIAK